MQSEKSKIKLTKYNTKQFSQLSTPQNQKNKPSLISTAFLSKKSQDPIIQSSRNKQSVSILQKNDRLQELSYNQEERKERKAVNFTIINNDLGKVEEDKYEKEELEAIDPIEMTYKFYQDNDLILEEFRMNTQELLKHESESVKQTIRNLTNPQGYQQPTAFKTISNNNYKIELHSKLKTLQFQSRDVGSQIAECKKWFAESKGAMNQIVNRINLKESGLQKVHDQKMNELNLKEKDLGEKQIALKRQEADLQSQRDDLAAQLKEHNKDKLNFNLTKKNFNQEQEQINKRLQERQLQLDQERNQFQNEKKEMEYLINQSFEECFRKDSKIQQLEEEVKNEKEISLDQNQKILKMQKEMSAVQLKSKQLEDQNQLRIKELEDELQVVKRKLKQEIKEKLQMQIQIPVEAQRLELPKDFKNIIPPIKPPNFEKLPMEVQQCYHNAVICNTFVKPPPIKEEIQNTNVAVQKSGIHKLMSCILNQVGAKYLISGNEEKSNLKTINMLASEQSNLACFSATFLNHNLTKSALEFQMEIKEALSECFKKSIHEISIVNQFPRNNDIIVNLVIDKVFKQDANVPQIAFEALQILRQRFQKNISLMPVKMFEFFYLGEKDFDSAGDIKFKSKNGLVFKRGGYDYNQPCNLYMRVGIKVSGKFDDGCDLWLKTDADGKGKEWAVGLHGLRHDVRLAVKGIIQNGFEVKRDQGFRGDIDIGRNKQNFVDQERCGNGIYLAPHVDICMGKNFEQLSYCRPVKFKDYYYIAIFQCRIKPSMIRIPERSKGEYYIINDPTNIRPYGIILRKYTKDQALEYINNLPREAQKQHFLAKMREEE